MGFPPVGRIAPTRISKGRIDYINCDDAGGCYETMCACGRHLVLTTAANAQGYSIQSPPGQQPSLATPYANGGYLVQTPGQPPTFANPMGNSGYVVQRPRQLPTFISSTGPPVIESPATL